MTILLWMVGIWFGIGFLTSIFITFFYCRGFDNLGDWIKATTDNPSKETLAIDSSILGLVMAIALIITGLLGVVISIGLIISVNDYLLKDEISKEMNKDA